MTRISPGDRVGARHFSTHSSNEAVDRPVESLLRHETGKAKAGDERDRLVMAVRNGGAQSPPASAASAFASQIRGRPGLVDEHELRRIEIELPGEPVPALIHNVRALLLIGVRGLS